MILLCTASSAVEPSSALLKEHAEVIKKLVDIEVALSTQAYDALFDGNRAKHDAILTEEAFKLAVNCDLIVLAQASLAHLRDPIAEMIGLPVLARPPLLIERLQRLLPND